MSELRKQMIRQMQVPNMSPSTQRGYLRAVTGLAGYYHRSPDRIGREEIQDYVAHLLSERKLAAGSCHSIITGPRFFYYGGGLRVSELVRLKVTDIHSMMIRVEQGKGRKDRYTLLPKRLLSELRSHWKTKRPAV